MRDNFRERTRDVHGIIIHSMAEYIQQTYAYDFLDNIGLSAHYLVSPNGEIINGPNPDKVAYHAGESEWEGETNLNESFVGIEVLVAGNHNFESFVKAIAEPETFNYAQYESTSNICSDLMDVFGGITIDRILRHSTVSGKDVRKDPKIDPGEGFNMTLLKKLINEKT